MTKRLSAIRPPGTTSLLRPKHQIGISAEVRTDFKTNVGDLDTA